MIYVTERDEQIVHDALATAFILLGRLPDDQRPAEITNDIAQLLDRMGGTYATVLLARATCRLNPGLDPLTVYRSFGIGEGASRDIASDEQVTTDRANRVSDRG